jgi:hypothetical protein
VNTLLSATQILADSTIDSNSGQSIYVNLRNWLSPIVFLIIAGISLTFLFRRQMSQFMQFIAIGVVVGILFWSPEIIQSAAAFFKTIF